MDKDKFSERFNKLLDDPQFIPTDPDLKALKEKRGSLAVADLAKYLKCSGQTLRNWAYGTSLPTLLNIESIANLFDVSEGWLLGYIDTAKTEDVKDYEPFRQLGFTPEAWESLTNLYNRFLKTSINPKIATTKMASTLVGINTILETLNEIGYYKTAHNNLRTNVFKNPFYINSSNDVPILTELSDFLDVKKPTFVYSLTDFLDLHGYLEDRDYLNTEDEQVLQDFCNYLFDYSSKRLINPVESDLFILNKLMDKLKQFKLLKIKEELQSIVYEITTDKNRDYREKLAPEELEGIDDFLRKKYHYLYSLFIYYSLDKK